MAALCPAARHGIPGDELHHAIDNAVTIDEAGEDPVGWLAPRPDRAGNLPELGGDGPADAPEGQARTGMNHERRTNGTPIAGADVRAMANEAGRGYDMDEFLHRRKGGWRALGSAAA